MPKVSPRPADRDLAELAADPANPRTISDEALAGLRASVENFGDLSGIVWNQRTGQLVTGHQRVSVLKDAGATTWHYLDDHSQAGLPPSVIIHPGTGQRFPIRIVDWDEATQRKANLVANSNAISGEYTAEALEQLRALEEDAAFNALRLDALMESITEDFPAPDVPGGGATDPDAVPEPPAEPITRPGDLWILGRTVCCPKCKKTTDV